MWRLFRGLQGLIEKAAVKGYGQGALQLGAQVTRWKGITITARPETLDKILRALELASHHDPEFHRSNETNIETIICADGIATRTLPVSRTFLINGSELGAEIIQLAASLVHSKAYISFYSGRFILWPKLLFSNRDKLAKSNARRIAEAFKDKALSENR